MASSKLFVGGLSWNTDSNALKDAFAAHGDIVEAKVITDRVTGRSRGFGFVTYSNPDDAQKALQMDGQQLDGRTIRVDLARDNREGGGGGGPRSGGPRSGGYGNYDR